MSGIANAIIWLKRTSRNYDEEEIWVSVQCNFRQIKSPRLPWTSVFTYLKRERCGKGAHMRELIPKILCHLISPFSFLKGSKQTKNNHCLNLTQQGSEGTIINKNLQLIFFQQREKKKESSKQIQEVQVSLKENCFCILLMHQCNHKVMDGISY